MNRVEAVQEFAPEPLHERANERGCAGGRERGGGLDDLSVGEKMRLPHSAQEMLVLTLLIPGIMGEELLDDDDSSTRSVVKDTGSITT